MADRMPFNLSNQRIRSTIPYSGAGTLRDALEIASGWHITHWYDDFLGDALDARYPAATTGVDGSFDKIASSVNGEATIDVGDGATSADDEYGGVGLGGLEWQGDLNAVMAVRMKLSAITTVKVEVGFTDSFADAGAVNDLSANTFTATDAALWIIDTDDTATWQGVGAMAGTPITKVEDGDIVAPAADTYQTMVVALEGNNAKFLQFNASGEKVYESIWQASAIEGGTNVGPWVFVQNRAGSIDRLVTIDSVFVAQRKT